MGLSLGSCRFVDLCERVFFKTANTNALVSVFKPQPFYLSLSFLKKFAIFFFKTLIFKSNAKTCVFKIFLKPFVMALFLIINIYYKAHLKRIFSSALTNANTKGFVCMGIILKN